MAMKTYYDMMIEEKKDSHPRRTCGEMGCTRETHHPYYVKCVCGEVRMADEATFKAATPDYEGY